MTLAAECGQLHRWEEWFDELSATDWARLIEWSHEYGLRSQIRRAGMDVASTVAVCVSAIIGSLGGRVHPRDLLRHLMEDGGNGEHR